MWVDHEETEGFLGLGEGKERKAQIWKADVAVKRILVPPYPMGYFLQFQLPVINHSPETVNSPSELLSEDQ